MTSFRSSTASSRSTVRVASRGPGSMYSPKNAPSVLNGTNEHVLVRAIHDTKHPQTELKRGAANSLRSGN
jgi:hypothetical protein